MFRTIAGLVAALLCLPINAGPAAAALATAPPAPAAGYAAGSGRPAQHESGARLTLSYMADAGYAAAVKLDCDPVGGGHPQGALACATLDAAGGDPERIPPRRTMCMTLYAPIVAGMSGTWRGSTVEWSHRYGNICEMRRATEVLFEF